MMGNAIDLTINQIAEMADWFGQPQRSQECKALANRLARFAQQLGSAGHREGTMWVNTDERRLITFYGL